jgi:hypothetical protein
VKSGATPSAKKVGAIMNVNGSSREHEEKSNNVCEEESNNECKELNIIELREENNKKRE